MRSNPAHFNIKTRLYHPQAGEGCLLADDAETASIQKVLRLKPGDPIAAFNGDGVEYIYQIDEAGKKTLEGLKVDEFRNPLDALPTTQVWIASTKGKTKDRMVRDLPPLGVTSILFYIAERSVSQPDRKQTERLQKIAIEACRQCGRSTIPSVTIHEQPLHQVWEQTQELDGSTIVFWEDETAQDLSLEGRGEEPVRLIFGPEGGFCPAEVDYASQRGAKRVSLGPRILRSELALVVGVTLAQSQRGLLTVPKKRQPAP